MPDRLYFSWTLSIYLTGITGAICIKDIGVIFEILSAICGSNLAYVLPALFYLKSEQTADYNMKYNIAAKLYLVLGIIIFILLLSAVVIDMIEE